MHTGKLSEIAYQRSVLKKIKTKTEGTKVGVESAPMMLEDVTCVMSSNCIIKWFEGCEEYYFQKALNGIYEQKAVPKYVQLTMNVPNTFEEKKLGKIVKNLSDIIEKKNMVICQCKVYVMNIEKPMVNITILGYSKSVSHKNGIQEGMHVVMAGTLAIGTTYMMSFLNRERLLEKFSGKFVDECICLKEFLDVEKMTDIARSNGAESIHAVNDGGVFGALWELVSSENLGIEIDIKKIPVWQEAIEIAEFFDYNPYQTDGTGAILVVTENAECLVQKLNEAGYCAADIGQITKGKDRIVINGDEKRYLEPPKGDEIYTYL